MKIELQIVAEGRIIKSQIALASLNSSRRLKKEPMKWEKFVERSNHKLKMPRKYLITFSPSQAAHIDFSRNLIALKLLTSSCKFQNGTQRALKHDFHLDSNRLITAVGFPCQSIRP